MPRITEGGSTVAGLFGWMRERHKIYEKRAKGDPWPWTDDPILREFKFTNVYRELDRGTLVLRELLEGCPDDEIVEFTTVWYRLFNWHENAEFGICGYYELADKVRARWRSHHQLFTNAHMSYGRAFEDKHETMLETIKMVYENPLNLAGLTLEQAFKEIRRRKLPGLGPFITYEIVSDLRWYHLDPSDRFTWANIGPGCKRGLLRLGLDVNLTSLHQLLSEAKRKLKSLPALELREIEHSLCEFDKYERVRLGQGRPRLKYHHGS